MNGQAYVCLLRGINVGGHNRVLMAPLRNALTSIGFEQVGSYLQSGNLVFGSELSARRVVTAVGTVLQNSFNLTARVQVRSAAELNAVAAAHPMARDAGEVLSRLQVGFLESAPAKACAASMAESGPSGEQWSLAGREFYAYYPEGCARSKWTTAYWEKGLQQSCTMRNWKTVSALNVMVNELSA